MSEKLLIPSIEQRLAALLEVSRRNLRGYSVTDQAKTKPTITISREFGCEAFPLTDRLKTLLEEKTGATWSVMDKALLEEVAKRHDLATEIFETLGEKRHSFIDDVISTFSPRWQSDKDYYRLLCKQIVALAAVGNVIIVGRGSSIVAQKMEHCFHFRVLAPMPFKIKSIRERMNLVPDEAEKLINKKQKQRDAFINDFLCQDVKDPYLYHLIFNNAKNTPDVMARVICNYVTGS
jgi:cytidylate kinase